jgi:hypothetical protein
MFKFITEGLGLVFFPRLRGCCLSEVKNVLCNELFEPTTQRFYYMFLARWHHPTTSVSKEKVVILDLPDSFP